MLASFKWYANALEYSFLIHNVCTLTIPDPLPSHERQDSSGHPCKVYVLFKTTTFLQTKLEQLLLLLQHCLIQATCIENLREVRYIIALQYSRKALYTVIIA